MFSYLSERCKNSHGSTSFPPYLFLLSICFLSPHQSQFKNHYKFIAQWFTINWTGTSSNSWFSFLFFPKLAFQHDGPFMFCSCQFHGIGCLALNSDNLVHILIHIYICHVYIYEHTYICIHSDPHICIGIVNCKKQAKKKTDLAYLHSARIQWNLHHR